MKNATLHPRIVAAFPSRIAAIFLSRPAAALSRQSASSFRRRILILSGCLCLTGCFPVLQAREKFNTALKVSFSGSVAPKIGWLAEEDFRPSGDCRQGEWSLTTAEINYRPYSWLRAGAGYMLMARLYRSDGLRNRYYIYSTASYQAGLFCFSVRERFQSTYRRGAAHPANYLRSMLMVSYTVGHTGAAPFVYAEPFNNTGYKGNMKADKIRLSAGCDYRIDPHNSFQLYYRYHIFNVYDPLNYRHALGVTYSHRF